MNKDTRVVKIVNGDVVITFDTKNVWLDLFREIKNTMELNGIVDEECIISSNIPIYPQNESSFFLFGIKYTEEFHAASDCDILIKLKRHE